MFPTSSEYGKNNNNEKQWWLFLLDKKNCYLCSSCIVSKVDMIELQARADTEL